MSDTKWERIATHLKAVESQESETYVNTLKGWLNEYDKGDAVLNKARRQWKETHPDWYKRLLAIAMNGNNTMLPNPPPDTDKGSPGSGDNQPIE